MPLELSKSCTVCKQIASGDDKLVTRLYKSSYYRGKKAEPWTRVALDYKGVFHLDTLRKHLREHQAITNDDLKKSHALRIAARENHLLIKEAIDQYGLLDIVIQKAAKGITSGRTKVSARDGIQAAKIKVDVDLKAKDQTSELLKEMFKLMSGEVIPDGAKEHPARSVIDVA